MSPPPKNFKKNLDDLFFIENGEIAVCLFCYAKLNDFKKDVLQVHFNAFHKNEITNLNTDQRNEVLSKHKAEYKKTFGENKANENHEMQRVQKLASYRIAYKIAKNSKPYNESEFIKECVHTSYLCLLHHIFVNSMTFIYHPSNTIGLLSRIEKYYYFSLIQLVCKNSLARRLFDCCVLYIEILQNFQTKN